MAWPSYLGDPDTRPCLIISKFEEPTEWLSNLVIIEKNDKSLRLCLDPRDLNGALEREYFEIPTLEEITSKLKNKCYFTVLDFKEGFYQVELDDKSSKLCAFGCPFGVYRFKRLPFGLNCAPEYFQKINHAHFGDIPGVIIYFDDLLIAAENLEEHDKILNTVLERARKANVKFNRNKIQYRVQQVKYLGNIFDRDGMRPDDSKVKAILELEEPKNRKELQRLLGMINYLRKFIPNLSDISAPLRLLLKKNTVWLWTIKHTTSLNSIKNLISSPPVLSNFDDTKPILIETDSSQSGLGCVLLQVKKPVAFASRALTDCETRFSQIEKEFIAILFACTKFHNYIYGRHVKIHSDHKPIEAIMKKGVSDVNSPRLQRIKVKLLKYDIDVEYKPGKEMFIADLLSRNYIKEIPKDDQFITEVVHSICMTDERQEEFKVQSDKDFELRKLKEVCFRGWPNDITKVPDILKKYYKDRNSIYVLNDLIFLDNRVIVPTSLRLRMLNQLHENHYGIVKTQQRAKNILYWPGINDDIKQFIQRCKKCERFQNSNQKEPLILRPLPDLPFQRLATDILEFGGQPYLVVIDYLSKWLEIITLESKTSTSVIRALKTIFCTHGIPQEIVADNMPFNSMQCREFARNWNFNFTTSSPRYPRSNGLAERAVQIAKNMLKKCDDIQLALLEYRNTPISGSDKSPAMLLNNRHLRSKLPIKDEVLVTREIDLNEEREKIENKRRLYKHYYDRTTTSREDFEEKDNVVIRDGKSWQPARVVKKLSEPRSYIVEKENGLSVRRNSYHLRPSVNQPRNYTNIPVEIPTETEQVMAENSAGTSEESQIICNKQSVSDARSKRPVKLPGHFADFIMS